MNSRAKGNQYELKITKKFNDLGWTEACSSRSESKRLDDAGVDICYTPPFNVQCKAVENLGSAHNTLARMPKKGINVVFHKKNRQGTVVSMSEEDFFTLIKTSTLVEKCLQKVKDEIQ